MSVMNERLNDPAELKTESGVLTIAPYAANIFKISYCPGVVAAVSPLEIAPVEASVNWRIEEDDCMLTAYTDLLRVFVDKTEKRISWMTSANETILMQPFPELSAQPVIKYRTDDTNKSVRRVITADGERNTAGGLVAFEDRTAYRAKVFFDWKPDESIFGLGQAEEGIYNLRGHVQYLYQHNMRTPVPFFVSDRGYGILFDSGCLMTFNDDSRGSYIFLDTVDTLVFYFIGADSLDGIISGFRRLTGRAALLPKWAYGYIQSKEAYHTQDELLDAAREYRSRRIPLDCIVQDWNTWEPGSWGNKRVDKTRYPNIGKMNDELHEMNVKSMISVWPNMNEGCGDYREMSDAGHLLADGSTYNAFSDAARRMYWKQAERELYSGGFDGWWCDSAEPFSGPDWNGEVLRESWERYCLVGGEHKKFLDPAMANLYGLYHAKGIFENQCECDPGRRVLNLTRAGSAGVQKYGAVLWSGDVCATWDAFKKQITEGLSLCMSGIPWWTLDIGGFFVIKDNWQKRGCGQHENPNPLWFWRGDYEEGAGDPGYRELYTRWLQMAAFLPMFRSHGTDAPREIWNFGEPGSMFYDAIEKFIRLRYKLMPYIYSLAGRVHFSHYTMMRSLLFDFASDKTAAKIHDQFMLGGALLICPVTQPLYYGPGGVNLEKERIKRCYLPSGCDWYDFWSDEKYQGGQWITVDAPIDSIPVFVKAGSIIPTEKADLEYTGQITEEPLEILVYPGADGEFILYEDSGDSYDYTNGIANQVSLKWDDTRRMFKIGKAAHQFPQSINGRKCLINVIGNIKEVIYTGVPMEIQGFKR